ncbi:sigma 54-interacting transcriptional regulator [Enterococcus sp. LJL120]
MSLKNEVIMALKIMNRETEEGSTSQYIADYLHVSRNSVSHHLNRLTEEKLIKKSKGRPVYYQLNEKVNSKRIAEIYGRDGSLKEIIDKSIAALTYPSEDLSLIFTGQSGVGKSYLANCIVDECKSRGLIDATASFLTLNCADYANNPELLSGNLFGYQKGAFTGADHEQEGMLKKADQGILFIDEIHRLSAENQEKLFLFMDKGQFSPLGDSTKIYHSNVKLMFATTENIEEALLTTFRRRISLKVKIPAFLDRPYAERRQIVLGIFQNESILIHKEIAVSADIVQFFCASRFEGNIGEIKSIIKIICAEAYAAEKKQHSVEISAKDHPDFCIQNKEFTDEKFYYLNLTDSTDLVGIDFVPADFKIDSRSIFKIEESVISILKQATGVPEDKNLAIELQLFRDRCLNQLGIEVFSKDFQNINTFWEVLKTVGGNKIFSETTFEALQANASLAYFFATQMFSELGFSKLGLPEKDCLCFFTVMILRKSSQKRKLPAILLAHGQSTAKSIGSMVNQLLKEPIFETIDLDIDSSVTDILNSIHEYMSIVNTDEGLVFIVDMGSLEQLYVPLKKYIKGDLLLINYLSTPIALDVGLKVQQGITIEDLATSLEGKHQVSVKSYEGFAKGKNIIISCISGMGIAQKIKQILSLFLSDIDLVTMEYQQLTDNLKYSPQFFKNTLCVVSTNCINSSDVKVISIEQLLNGNDKDKLLLSILGDYQYQKLINELNIFFSIEGIRMNLAILNPEIVINEMVQIIEKLEAYFATMFQSYLKRNLLNHLSLMVERVILGHETSKHKDFYSDEEANFFSTAKQIFLEIEKKYNIVISDEEYSLIYQIISVAQSE